MITAFIGKENVNLFTLNELAEEAKQNAIHTAREVILSLSATEYYAESTEETHRFIYENDVVFNFNGTKAYNLNDVPVAPTKDESKYTIPILLLFLNIELATAFLAEQNIFSLPIVFIAMTTIIFCFIRCTYPKGF